MKKTIAKAAALIMAAMMTASACTPLTVSAVSSADTSKADEKNDSEMKAALTVAKKRITIPPELTEFDYVSELYHGNVIYKFIWSTPAGVEKGHNIQAAVIGDIIIYYYNSKIEDEYHNDFKNISLAKLSEKELIGKAEENLRRLDPDICGSLKLDVDYCYLASNIAEMDITRYENGVEVRSNTGYMELNKNTGELYSFKLDWLYGASFADSKNAKSEKALKVAYTNLCRLTPYYKISSEYDEKTNESHLTARLVYDPEMEAPIDAFTGDISSMNDDMKKTEGSWFYGYDSITDPHDPDDAAADAGYGEYEDGLTPEELEKLEKDSKLPKADELFKRFKKDPYIALNDSYKLCSYSTYTQAEDFDGTEFTCISLSYKFDGSKDADNYYKRISVKLNGETGEIFRIHKYELVSSGGLPKLDVKKANAAASAAANSLAKNIISEYKPDPKNTRPAETNSSANGDYEDERYFIFNRYVNGIQVDMDDIVVRVDSLGNVVEYSYSYTGGVNFPKADIIGTKKAFEKLYEQKEPRIYYDCFIDKDNKVHTYLMYDMDDFYLNALTGDICERFGGEPYGPEYIHDIEFTDIKGIPQEEAIRALQRYDIAVTDENNFEPNALITEREFAELLNDTLYTDMPDFAGTAVTEDMTPEEKARVEAEKKDQAVTTVKEAAVIFAKSYDPYGIGELDLFFKTPFSNVKASDENAGYISIAYAKGFIPQSEDGKLKVGHKLTRAEATQMIYDYLKVISK